ncbi:hypothetical protein PM082_020843 [Marasmius tenuissimus]|nr:hypothetical protein PM082_020843 [Marasmius tenuissimus]
MHNSKDLYYNAFPNDALKFQLLVYGIYIVELAQTILVTHDVFEIFAYGYGSMKALNEIHLLWFHACILPGLVAFTVQVFFAYRIFLLSRSKILSVSVVVTALTQLAAAVTTAIFAKKNATWSNVAEDKSMVPVVAIWLAGCAFCDILIACSMTYVLSRCNLRFKETRNLVNRVIRLTMETGSLTAVVTSLHLILFVVMSNKNYHIAPDLVLAKLYSNSMMVVFNSRIQIHNSRGCGRGQSKDPSGMNETNSMVLLTIETSRVGCSGDVSGVQQVEGEESTEDSWNGDCPMNSVKLDTV